MSPSNWDQDPLQTGFPVTWSKGDTNKLIPTLMHRMMNEPTDSIPSPRG